MTGTSTGRTINEGQVKEKVGIEPGNVQKTLLLQFRGRATKAVKPRSMPGDRAAVEIINRIDYDFSERIMFIPVSQSISAFC
jgi:O-methyltransferase involved in polyketide biosynthesis